MQISEQGNHIAQGTTMYGTFLRVTAFASFDELNIGAFDNPPRLILMTRLIQQLQAAGTPRSMVLLIQH